MKKRIRIWAIKQGFIAPSSLKETREIFPFPDKVKPIPHQRLNFLIQP